MYFKLIFTSFSLLLLFSCSSEYELFVSDFPHELSQSAIDACSKENPKFSKSACDIKKCLSSPITLLGMEMLLKNFDTAMKKAGIPYWIDAGTAIGPWRGLDLLPWDDDVDIGVFEGEFTRVRRERLEKELLNLGFEFAPFHTLMALLGREGLYQISFTKKTYFDLVYSYKPNISKHDVESLWIRYDRNGRLFPHIDLFIFEEKADGKFNYQSSYFAKLCKGGMERIWLEPTKNTDILGKKYPFMYDFNSYSKVCYKTDKIKTDYVIFAEHKISSDCSKIKLRLEDINQHKEYKSFFDKYLKWVFGDRFTMPIE